MSTEGQTGTYVNGKKQATDLLQALSPKERDRILKHIRIKNPSLASELSQKSFSFNSIKELNEYELTRLSSFTNPKIFGIALKGVTQEGQREILSKLPRGYAETTYDALLASQGNDPKSIERAQERTLEALNQLVKSKQVSL